MGKRIITALAAAALAAASAGALVAAAPAQATGLNFFGRIS